MKLFLKGERCFTPKCAVERRPTPPGAAPSDRRRRKESEFNVQLKEKQKARHIYGVLERQFHKHFLTAEHQPGVTGENLLRVLEMRLDNVVYRLGFADSRKQARQLVLHGHIMLTAAAPTSPQRSRQGDASPFTRQVAPTNTSRPSRTR
jgi:small subunit ribosomal protein S4